MPKPAFELSRPVDTDHIPVAGLEIAVDARESERAALAQRLGVISVESLQAQILVTRDTANAVVEVTGTFSARLTQQCVVTLEPVAAEIVKSRVFGLYAPEAAIKKSEVELSDAEEDEVEPIPPHGEIDVGELVAQHLALAIDPYPRKPGAAFTPPSGADTKISPFSKLASLKKKD